MSTLFVRLGFSLGNGDDTRCSGQRFYQLVGVSWTCRHSRSIRSSVAVTAASQRLGNGLLDPLDCLDEMPVGKMGVTGGGPVPAVSEYLIDKWQVLTHMIV